MFTKTQEAQRERLRDKAHVKQIEMLWCEDDQPNDYVRSNPRHTPDEAVAAAIGFIDEHEGHDTRLVILNSDNQSETVPDRRSPTEGIISK